MNYLTNLVQFPGLGLSFQLNRVAFTIAVSASTGTACASQWVCVWRWSLPSGTVWNLA